MLDFRFAKSRGVIMRQVYERLFVGSEYDCFHTKDGWAVVHACKSPCHQRAIGYRGSLPKNHPNYLILERDNNLYLNMVDPPVPLFKLQTFIAFLRFAEKHWNDGKNILIHCNQGESRAPSLALLFLAKILKTIDGTDYDSAAKAYKRIDPYYMPTAGIQTFLRENWNGL